MPCIGEHTAGVVLRVLVQPRASRNHVAGLHGDALKVRITAPPVDGAANSMCIRFLARQANVPKSDVELIAGRTSRSKQLLFHWPPGVDSPKARRRFLAGLKAAFGL
jgi:uncharacterized protein (TIGR00251 family)